MCGVMCVSSLLLYYNSVADVVWSCLKVLSWCMLESNFVHIGSGLCASLYFRRWGVCFRLVQLCSLSSGSMGGFGVFLFTSCQSGQLCSVSCQHLLGCFACSTNRELQSARAVLCQWKVRVQVVVCSA